LLVLLNEGLAVLEQLGGVRVQAATAAARVACKRPQAIAHLPGIAVLLDRRLRRQYKGGAHGAVKPRMPIPMMSCYMPAIRRIPHRRQGAPSWLVFALQLWVEVEILPSWVRGSCTPTLRTIPLAQKPCRMSPSHYALEGARP